MQNLSSSTVFLDGAFLTASDARCEVFSHALHYGSGVFEGIRFYETENGPAIFRLQEHIDRLFFSAGVICLPIGFSAEEITEAARTVVEKNQLKSGYIRPLAFFGEGKMGLRPEGARPHFFIGAWAWGRYLSEHPISVKISKYIRHHPQSLVAEAKVTGHYVNSILAVQEVVPLGYDEALLLDHQGYVAEGPGENFFLVKDGKIHTPSLGNILPGITRSTICTLAEAAGLSVTERPIFPEEIFSADEAFFTGTAAEVTSIGKVNDQPIGGGNEGKITAFLKSEYAAVVQGKHPKYASWLTFIKK